MKKDNFELFAKEKITQQNCIADSEAIWASVEAELYPESKRKPIWFRLFGMLALVGLAFLIGYLVYNKNNPSAYTHTTEPTIEKTRKTESENPNINIVNKSEAPISESNQNIAAKNNLTPTIKIEPPQKISITSHPQTKNNAAMINVDDTINFTSMGNIKMPTTPIHLVLAANTSNEKIKTSSYSTSNVLVRPAISKSQNINTPLQESNTSKEIGLSKIEVQNLLAIDGKEFDDNMDDKLKELIPANNSSAETTNTTPKKFSFGLSASTGVAFTNTTLNTINNIESDLLRVRSQSESDLETLDFDFGFSIKHKSGFYLNTGINYRRSSRKLEFKEEIQSTESIVGRLRLVVDPITLNPSFIKVNLTQIVTSNALRESFNTTQLYNIPLDVGYQFRIKKWSLGVEAGALFNIQTQHNGFIQDSSRIFYNLRNDPLNWFKNKLDLHFRSAAFIGYNLNSRYQITIGPYINTAVNLNYNSNPIDQNQSALGARASIKYWFN